MSRPKGIEVGQLGSDILQVLECASQHGVLLLRPDEAPGAGSLYRLELDNQKRVLAHPAGAAQINFVRLLPGDRVEVELGSNDLTRGRITRKL